MHTRHHSKAPVASVVIAAGVVAMIGIGAVCLLSWFWFGI